MLKEMEHCQKCGIPYETVWRAPDNLWGKVTGHNDGGGLLCIQCFDKMAREQGIFLYWECESRRFPTKRESVEDHNG